MIDAVSFPITVCPPHEKARRERLQIIFVLTLPYLYFMSGEHPPAEKNSRVPQHPRMQIPKDMRDTPDYNSHQHTNYPFPRVRVHRVFLIPLISRRWV